MSAKQPPVTMEADEFLRELNEAHERGYRECAQGKKMSVQATAPLPELRDSSEELRSAIYSELSGTTMERNLITDRIIAAINAAGVGPGAPEAARTAGRQAPGDSISTPAPAAPIHPLEDAVLNTARAYAAQVIVGGDLTPEEEIRNDAILMANALLAWEPLRATPISAIGPSEEAVLAANDVLGRTTAGWPEYILANEILRLTGVRSTIGNTTKQSNQRRIK